MTAEPEQAARYFVFPASRAQQRLYFLQRLLGDAPTYTIPLFFSLRGALDLTALAAAVGDVMDRHEALRTHFAIEDTTLMQVIDPAPRPAWRVDTGTDVAAWMAGEAARPFDLDHGPLFRAAVLRRGADDAVLMLAMHHIVADGWSLAVLLRDLQACYLARTAGGTAPAAPELQYADFSAWQDTWLTGAGAAGQARYWRDTLGGDLPVLRLPTDRPRPPGVPATTGDSHLFALPGDAVDELARLCRAEGCTLFAGLLSAFAVLLGRLSGLDDVVIGSPVANRTRHEFDGTVGLFVNTIAVRCDLSGGPTYREVLRRVGRAAVDAYANQELPFERVVQEVNPDRGADRDPVFQVMFSLHNTPTTRWELPGLVVSELENPVRNAKVELELDLVEAGDGLAAVLQYRTELFDAETVRRLAGHYCRLLEGIAHDPDRPAATLPILTEAERAALLPVPREGGPVRCCHELFEEWAARRADAVAVCCGAVELTYRQLDERANQLAHRLRAGGVGPEVLVGLSVTRSVELVVGILGIAKAGGAYLPLDPDYPAARLAFLVRDTGIAHLVVDETVHSGLADRFAGFDGLVVRLDEASGPVTAPISGVTPGHLAYVIHTSGSTGRPKGTLVTHHNVARLFAGTRRWFDLDHDDVWTMFHSYAFDFSVWELWGALTTGGRLVMVPTEVSRSPTDFHRLLREHQVTVLSQTPSAFRRLIAADEAGGRLSLRYVVLGGEALDPATLRPWFRRHGDERPRVVNMYGITEATVHATYRRIVAADLDRGDSPIGVPLADLAVCVLDAGGEPAPVGVPGELVISGAGVARGYLGRPELSARRFVRHPADPTHPAYRTGDLVKRLPGGELVYLGRIDDQLKIRGFRVEPGEIEATLVGHPLVREAVVLAATDIGGDRRLVGYLTVDPAIAGTGPEAGELREFLRRTLPDHLVPAEFVVLDALPVNRNGKVDRARLPELGGRRVEAGRFAAPDTIVERALAEVWAETLGVARVGVDDSYFALGGDSVRSIQLLATAQRRGLRFTLPDLLRFQTIRQLARHTTIGDPAEPDRTDLPFELLSGEDRALVPDGVVDAYPLTSLQAGMIYHGEAHRLYHNVAGYLVRAEYSEPVWRWAVATVVARHEILRTSFDLHRFTEPTQLVHAEVDPPITFEDLGALTADDQRAAADRRLADERARPLRWDTAPLIRLHVQRLDADLFQLWIAEHHAILDGWSERTLFAELVTLYLHGLEHGPGQAPESVPAVRFRDFVELERHALGDERHRRFWLELLRDSTFAELPRWRPPRDEPDQRLLEVDIADLSAGVERLAHRLNTSVRTVVITAHVRVLGLLTGGADVVTGVVHHGRPETAGGDQVLGLFLNTLPLRVRLPGGTWAELVTAVAALDLELRPHRRYPLARLQHELRRPLFDSFVNYTRFDAAERDGFEVLAHDGHAGTSFAFGAEFSLTDTLGLALRFDAARFDPDQLARIGGYYRAVLAAMGDPDGRYDVSLLSDAEHLELASWNATLWHHPQPHVLHELVRRQAARTPDLVACEFEDERLGYAELDERATALAHRLVDLGAGPGRFVGICLRRSPELVVGLLATLKAGAAYVPIDPDDPPARIAALVGAAGVELVLAEPGSVELSGVRVVDRFDGFDSEPAPVSAPALPAVEPSDAAYLIFTSGSTGQPKGVVVSHRAICNRLLWMQRAYRLDQGEAVLQKTPHTFDVSVWEFFWPLTTGGRLVLARPAGHRDPAYLSDLVQRRGVSTVHFVPSMLAAFLDHGSVERCASLRRVICSGEALPAALARRFRAGAPASVELHNLYGPTEAAVDVTHWHCVEDGGDSVPVGRPIDNVTVHVLDAYRCPVPVGVTGELYLGGVCLADGYHGEPELTARRFVSWADHDGTARRLYRTGDLARRRPDGALDFLGRTDDQLKIRGMRVEPGEVESVLRGHDAVRDAAVAWHDDLLTGHVVLDRPVEPSELARWLGVRLPAHLVPARWAVHDALPLTRNGKVDRAALRAAVAGEVARSAYVPPRDDHEAVLAELFENVLGVRPVGALDDFFAAGGNSLSALRLAALVENRFRCGLPLDTVLRARTVAALADAVRTDGAFDALVPLRPAGSDLAPLFLPHPAGGTVFCYRELAAALPPGRPVYGLAASDVDPGGTVSELADRYLPLITALVPGGPYHLAGWSFGGLVAFELAHRLSTTGPVTLAMIDTGFPAGEPPADARAWFEEDLRRTNGVTTDDHAVLDRRFAIYRANLAAHAGYRPRPYRGPVLSVHSQDSPEAADAWRHLADPATHSAVTLAADHYALMRPPHVATVARLLADFLDDASRRW